MLDLVQCMREVVVTLCVLAIVSTSLLILPLDLSFSKFLKSDFQIIKIIREL